MLPFSYSLVSTPGRLFFRLNTKKPKEVEGRLKPPGSVMEQITESKEA